MDALRETFSESGERDFGPLVVGVKAKRLEVAP